MSALKLFSILLDYPRDELWLNRNELLEAADGVQLSKARRSQLKAFVTELLEQPPMAAQEAWLGLFHPALEISVRTMRKVTDFPDPLRVNLIV